MKIAIVGFGNVGKEVLTLANNYGIDVTAVVSRRQLDVEGYLPLNEVKKLKGKVDALLLTMGSAFDLPHFAPTLAKDFNTVDAYDCHGTNYLDLFSGDKLSLCCCGWDPGVFSVLRTAMSTYSTSVETLWGRGISQGHTNVLKSIGGVIDAIEITEPLEHQRNRAKLGKKVEKHKRICYVCAKENHKNSIAQAIATSNFFNKDETTVEFVDEATLEKVKITSHKGEIIARGIAKTNFTLTTDDNAKLTASILLAYSKAVPKLIRDGYKGVHTPLTVPLCYLT